jgi:hypothetical protein
MKIAKYFSKSLKKCFVITIWPYMVVGCNGNSSPLYPYQHIWINCVCLGDRAMCLNSNIIIIIIVAHQ